MSRIGWALLCAGTIAAGLGSRVRGLPDWVHAYVGDALYAVLIFGLVGLVAPRAMASWRALTALGVCFVIEASQAWHPAWLDALRASTLGALVFGRGFLWSDLVSYTVGVGVALAAEVGLAGRFANKLAPHR